jgi:hypothetical protein
MGKIQDWLTEDGLLQIQGWARDGLSLENIAHNIGINVSTFYEWKKKKPEIREALKKGAAPADVIVENALYKRATGYKTIERKKIKLPDGTTRVEVIEKEVPPDTTAGIFWLANRKPERWKRKQVNEIRLEEIEDETREDIEKFIQEAKEKHEADKLNEENGD